MFQSISVLSFFKYVSESLLRNFVWAGKIAQPPNLSSIFGIHIVEGETLSQKLLFEFHRDSGTCYMLPHVLANKVYYDDLFKICSFSNGANIFLYLNLFLISKSKYDM